jgi:myosin heavy subunit
MSMDYVEEAPLLGLLRRRFNEDRIYTFASNMLLSINPYKPIPGLLDTMELDVSEGVVVKMPTPHVYTVASRSYADMLRTQRGQSVLMSGESGAGKTEASKLVVRYLVSSPAVLSRCKASMGYGGKGAQFSSQLEESVIRSVPLLEAFGNAQTVNNINSSRFGKLLTLHYSGEGAVLGAATTTFLLEKSRLVQHSAGERNFHVFYRLVKDADAALRGRLRLTQNPGDYAYLTALEDGARGRIAPLLDADAGTGGLPALLAQLSSIGIGDDDLAAVWDVLAGILHLGNVEFVAKGAALGGHTGDSALRRPNMIVKSAGGEASIKPDAKSTAALEAVSHLWKVPLPLLTLALTERTMSAGKRKSVSSIPLTPQQAIDARNGLAKAVYERLFTWLVGKVNAATHAPDPSTLPPPVATGSYFANAATAAAAASKLFEAPPPKPPKPPKEKPAPPVAAPRAERGPPKVTEIYTKVTGAKAVSFVSREMIGLRPKFVVPQEDEYDVSSDEEPEDDSVAPPLPPSSPFIAILDIFGFEVLQNNGFEQLCINFANEALQQFFIQSVFVTETREYMKQGLSGWQSVPFKDNQENIDIILRKPVGLLSYLDQQVVLGERYVVVA